MDIDEIGQTGFLADLLNMVFSYWKEFAPARSSSEGPKQRSTAKKQAR